MLQNGKVLGLIFVLSAGGWLWSAGLLFAQEPSAEPAEEPEKPTRTPVEVEQVYEDWSYHHYVKDDLHWSAEGKTARIIGQSEFHVKTITVTYYLIPENETVETPPATGTTPTQKSLIVIRADEGVIKKTENSSVLKGNIRITKGNISLETTELVSIYSPEKKEVSLSSNEVVTLTNFANPAPDGGGQNQVGLPAGRPGRQTGTPLMVVYGKGFKSEANLTRFFWFKEVKTVISGSALFPIAPLINTAQTGAGTPFNSDDSLTTITCDGPLQIDKVTEENRIKYIVTYQNNVLLVKEGIENGETNRPGRQTGSADGGVNVLAPSPEGPSEQAEPISEKNIGEASKETPVPSEITLKADILKILITRDVNQSPKSPKGRPLRAGETSEGAAEQKEIVVLKGKKEAWFYLKRGVTANADESKKVEGNPRILITSEGDCYIYADFQKVFFRHNVRVTSFSGGRRQPKEEVVRRPAPEGCLNDGNGTRRVGSQLTCERLNLFIDRANNEITGAQAERNILLVSEAGERLSADFLEWRPAEYLLNIKSRLAVKIWSEGKLLSADEVIIQTARNEATPLGKWQKIETKSKNGSSFLKIPEK